MSTGGETGCMICGNTVAADVEADVSLHGSSAPAGRHRYEPQRIRLCAAHLAEYHGPAASGERS